MDDGDGEKRVEISKADYDILNSNHYIFQTKKCRIANPILEDNFREFCRECVFQDLGLGIYSKEELVHTTDLLQFLEKNTSKIRMVYYRETREENAKTSALGSFIPCRDAMKRTNGMFNQTPGNTKEILLGEIGSDFHFLLGQKTAGEGNLTDQTVEQTPSISHNCCITGSILIIDLVDDSAIISP